MDPFAFAHAFFADPLGVIRAQGDVFYLITFVWTFLEGETFVIFAGLAAQQGALDLPTVILVAWAGSFCGDNLYFACGRIWGRRIVGAVPRLQRPVEAVNLFLRRWGTWFILSFRFIYGIRNFASFGLGMSEVPWLRFIALNFVAAGLWAVTFAGFGYLFGAAFQDMLGDLAQDFGKVMLIVFAVMLGGPLLIRWIIRLLRRPKPQDLG